LRRLSSYDESKSNHHISLELYLEYLIKEAALL